VVDLVDDAGGDFGGAFHVPQQMGDDVRLDRELTIREQLDQDRAEQRLVRRLNRDVRQRPQPGATRDVSRIDSLCSRARFNRWNSAFSSPIPASRFSIANAVDPASVPSNARAVASRISVACTHAACDFVRQTLTRWLLPAPTGPVTTAAQCDHAGQPSTMPIAAEFEPETRKSSASNADRWARSNTSCAGSAVMPAALILLLMAHYASPLSGVSFARRFGS
jgi:hypothetical protein